jgi:hypothetical protein
MAEETLLILLRDEINCLQEYSNEQSEIFFSELLEPSNNLYERSIELSRMIKECSQRIAFYQKQLKDLGFFIEESNDMKLNQTLTGSC